MYCIYNFNRPKDSINLSNLAPVTNDKAKNILPEIKQVGRHFKTCATMINVMACVNVIK